MADLGVINQIDPQRGVRAPDRRDELRAQGQLLDAAGTIIKETIVGGVEDEIVDDLQSQIEGLSSDPMGPPEELANEEAKTLTRRVEKLVQAKEAGTQSQKTLAEMQIKQTIADATNKYPWLREELMRRAGMVSQLATELDQLGLYDAALEAKAQLAADRLDDIQTHATKNLKDGGLGIDPSITIGSAEWVRKYQDRQMLKDANDMRQMKLMMRDNISTDLFGDAVQSLQGSISSTRLAIEGVYEENGMYAVLNEVLKGEGGNPEALRQFKEVGINKLQIDLQRLNSNMIAVYETKWAPQLAGTEDGKVIKKMLDDAVAENNRRITLAQQIADGVPGAAEMFDSLRTVRRLDIYRGQDQAYKSYDAWITDPGYGSMLDLLSKDYSGAGLNVMQGVASHATRMVSNLNPAVVGPDASVPEQLAMAYFTSGQGAIGPSLTPGQVLETLNKQQRDAKEPFTLKSETDRDDQIGAVTTLELHRELWNKARSIDSQASEYKAATFANGVSAALIGLTNSGVRPDDVDEWTLANLADETTKTMIEKLGDGEYGNSRRALGMQMKNYYVSTQPEARRKTAIETYNAFVVGQTPLDALVQVDTKRLTKEGQVDYVINPEALKREVEIRYEPQATAAAFDALDATSRYRGSIPDKAKIENEVINEIQEVMDPIINLAEQDLNIHLHMRMAERPILDTNEGSLRMKYFDTLGWLDGFRFAQGD